MEWYAESVKAVMQSLKSSPKGLSHKEAVKRLQRYGKNTLGTEKKISFFHLLVNQFNDPLVWVLLFAVGVSFFIDHYIDAIVILAILLFNAAFGFFQEYKAEKAVLLLEKLREYKATVLRDGKEVEVLTEMLVPGDILLLREGDKVPADCRVLSVAECKVDEASLTGESVPVRKIVTTLGKTVVLADRKNMLFMGTVIVRGKVTAIVTGTGKKTELGKIAQELSTIEEEVTPLQKRLKEIGRWLTFIVVGISVLVFLLGIWRGFAWGYMFLTAVSLAVAAIPEGLPAVVTITLALGLRRMLKRKALIRKLRSVETLGSVTVICSDKTGTITKNEMTVMKIFANGKEYAVTGSGYELQGAVLFNGKKAFVGPLLQVAASCNDATVDLGDPTERALQVLAAKMGVHPTPRVAEVPFSSEKKYMSVTDKQGVVSMKGALEVVLKKCSLIEIDGKRRKLTASDTRAILAKNSAFSKEALRVLAFAYGKKQLTFLGIVGMMDPPRADVRQAINLCHTAGIRSIMITGDHALTAKAVAKKVGIQGKVVIGEELDTLSDERLQILVKKVGVFARVTSLHKARILKALQANGEIVAMTGDGVNDAPALKQANVGVAMNLKGTEISKDVAHLILLDDQFGTIAAAVEEGRVIYNNIKKFVKYLLAANFGEIAIILLPILWGIPLPLLPVQLLWVNLVTDSFPALALGADPADPGVMKKKPRDPQVSFFKGIKGFMLSATILSTVVTLGLFLWYYRTSDLDTARTVALTTLVLFELFLVFACRSESVSVFKLKANWWLYGAVAFSFGLHLVLLYTPLALYFSLVPLTLADWILILPLAAIGLFFFEAKKLLSRSKG